jgi:hypothetical protein
MKSYYSKTRYRGVRKRCQHFQVIYDSEVIATFPTAEEAAKYYDRVAISEFKRKLNFPEAV